MPDPRDGVEPVRRPRRRSRPWLLDRPGWTQVRCNGILVLGPDGVPFPAPDGQDWRFTPTWRPEREPTRPDPPAAADGPTRRVLEAGTLTRAGWFLTALPVAETELPAAPESHFVVHVRPGPGGLRIDARPVSVRMLAQAIRSCPAWQHRPVVLTCVTRVEEPVLIAMLASLATALEVEVAGSTGPVLLGPRTLLAEAGFVARSPVSAQPLRRGPVIPAFRPQSIPPAGSVDEPPLPRGGSAAQTHQDSAVVGREPVRSNPPPDPVPDRTGEQELQPTQGFSLAAQDFALPAENFALTAEKFAQTGVAWGSPPAASKTPGRTSGETPTTTDLPRWGAPAAPPAVTADPAPDAADPAPDVPGPDGPTPAPDLADPASRQSVDAGAGAQAGARQDAVQPPPPVAPRAQPGGSSAARPPRRRSAAASSISSSQSALRWLRPARRQPVAVAPEQVTEPVPHLVTEQVTQSAMGPDAAQAPQEADGGSGEVSAGSFPEPGQVETSAPVEPPAQVESPAQAEPSVPVDPEAGQVVAGTDDTQPVASARPVTLTPIGAVLEQLSLDDVPVRVEPTGIPVDAVEQQSGRTASRAASADPLRRSAAGAAASPVSTGQTSSPAMDSGGAVATGTTPDPVRDAASARDGGGAAWVRVGSGVRPGDREQVRSLLGWRYEAHSRAVTGILALEPGLRARAGQDDLILGLVAVHAYLAGASRVIDAVLRGEQISADGGFAEIDAEGATLLARCARSGLDRLPAVVGPVFRAGSPGPEQIRHYRSGLRLVEPTFTEARLNPTAASETTVEYAIWSSTARRTDRMTGTENESRVVFAPGTQFVVLDVVQPQDGDQLRVLLWELPARSAGGTPDRQTQERTRKRLWERLTDGPPATQGRPGLPDQWHYPVGMHTSGDLFDLKSDAVRS